MENYKVQRKISTHLEDLIRANVDIIFPKRLDFGKRGDMPHHTTLLMLRPDLWCLSLWVCSAQTRYQGLMWALGRKEHFFVCSAVHHLFSWPLTVPVSFGGLCCWYVIANVHFRGWSTELLWILNIQAMIPHGVVSTGYIGACTKGRARLWMFLQGDSQLTFQPRLLTEGTHPAVQQRADPPGKWQLTGPFLPALPRGRAELTAGIAGDGESSTCLARGRH